MKYEELVDFYNKEKEADGLHPVPSNFYLEVHELLEATRKDRTCCEHYQDRDQLDDQVRGMLQMIEAIYDKRTVKIMELAMLQQPAGRDQLTPEEKMLFQTVQEALSMIRTSTLERALSF